MAGMGRFPEDYHPRSGGRWVEPAVVLDFAISGGGTMNREAAALRVPVYSIFRGKIGDVDRYLSKEGRLILLESVADVHDKLQIVKRSIPEDIEFAASRTTLKAVVEGILKALN